LIALFGVGVLAVGLSTGPTAKSEPAPAPAPAASPTASPSDAPAQGADEAKPADPNAPDPAEEAKNKEFEAQMERAKKAVDAKDFEEAAAALEAAYRLSPTRQVLLDWAHAERFAEQCDRALFLYDRYLASIAEDVASGDEQAVRKDKTAREGRDECREEMEEGEAAAMLIIPPPRTSAPKPKEDDKASAPAPQTVAEPVDLDAEPEPAPTEHDKGLHVTTWRKDPVGWSLFGAGLLSLVGSGAMFAVAYTGKPDPLTAPSHAAYLDAVDRSSRLEVGGWTFVGIGSALVLSGIIRLAFVSSREHNSRAKRKARGRAFISNWGRF
jgi:hypothetical protein